MMKTVIAFIVISAILCIPVAADSSASLPVLFFDDFTEKSINPNNWLIAHRQWAGLGVNGGVVPQNVSVADGNLILEAHGDLYEGPVKGINKFGVPRQHGRRVGAAVATKNYYGSGRYEVRAKIAPRLGVASAFFTSHYRELYRDDPGYQIPHDRTDCYITNHEIDIEFPGRPRPIPLEGISFKYGLFNTWRGQQHGEFSHNYIPLEQAQNDGQYHVYRFDWHTGGSAEAETPRVDFYIDGQRVLTSTQNIPTFAGRFWLGVWFPDKWAGDPQFDTTRMYVDWVRFTPFNEPNDEFIPESYSDDGWAQTTKITEDEISAQHSDGTADSPPSFLHIADFDNEDTQVGAEPAPRVFYLLPSKAAISTTTDVWRGGSGRSLQIEYEKYPRGNCGFWIDLGQNRGFIDARQYRFLTFHVKGENGGEDFDVGLADRHWFTKEDTKLIGSVRDFLLQGVTQQWQQVRVPLSKSLGLQLNDLRSLSFICRSGNGRFYIDDLRLEN